MGAIDDLYEEQFSDWEARRELYSDYYSSLTKAQKVSENKELEGDRSAHK